MIRLFYSQNYYRWQLCMQTVTNYTKVTVAVTYLSNISQRDRLSPSVTLNLVVRPSFDERQSFSTLQLHTSMFILHETSILLWRYNAVTGHYIVPLAKLTKLIHSQTVVHHEHVAHQFSNSVSSHPENNIPKVKVMHLYPVYIKCISFIPMAVVFARFAEHKTLSLTSLKCAHQSEHGVTVDSQ